MKNCIATVLVLTLMLTLLVGCGEGPAEGDADSSGLPPDAASAVDALADGPADPTSDGTQAPTGTLPEDVPLAWFMQLYSDAAGGLVTNLVQQNETADRDAWLEKTRAAWQALADAEALPPKLVADALEYTGRGTVNYTVQTDSMNCENLTCNFGMGVEPPYYLHNLLVPEGDKAVSTSASLPFEWQLDEAGRDALATNYIAYLGLDAFGDWEKLPHTDDEAGQAELEFMSRFYSASAQMTLSAAWHCYPDETQDYTFFSIICEYVQPE